MRAKNNPDLRILEALCRIAYASGKAYCAPEYPTIQELMKLKRSLPRRTFNRHLDALEREDWIRRVRRYTKDGAPRPTLYVVKKRAWSWWVVQKHERERPYEIHARELRQERSGLLEQQRHSPGHYWRGEAGSEADCTEGSG